MRWLRLIWIICFGLVLGWSLIPAPVRRLELTIAAGQANLPTGSTPTGMQTGRQLTLLFPAHLRLGESGEVQLKFAPSPLAEAQTEAADIYATHTILAEARLELSNGILASPDKVQASLPRDAIVTFRWQISPAQGREIGGEALLTLYYFPLDGSPTQDRLISAQKLKIGVTSFFGFSIQTARWIGLVGLAVGGIFIWKARRRKKSRHA